MVELVEIVEVAEETVVGTVVEIVENFGVVEEVVGVGIVVKRVVVKVIGEIAVVVVETVRGIAAGTVVVGTGTAIDVGIEILVAAVGVKLL